MMEDVYKDKFFYIVVGVYNFLVKKVQSTRSVIYKLI
jgi:hypothetical protein